MPLPPEPRWMWETCFRGHPLRIHGRPRADKVNSYHCRACVRITRAARESRPLGESRFNYEPDPSAVRRIVSGDRPVGSHWTEVYEAVRILTSRGYSTSETAGITGASTRTVARHRSRMKRGLSYGTEG